VVRVHCNEGRANHIGPQPCVSSREVGGEASVGESAGQVLSRVSKNSRVPTRSTTWKATLLGAFRECLQLGVVEDPGMYRSSLFGNREISCLTAHLGVRSASGR